MKIMEEKKLLKKKQKVAKEGNCENLAAVCRELGDFYNQHGQYNKAILEYKEESQIYHAQGNQLKMAKACRMIGEMNMLLSEFDEALDQINIYLKVSNELANKVEEQRAYATLGRAYLLYGQSESNLPIANKYLKNAEKSFIQSLLICKQLQNLVSKIELLDMQTRLYLNIGVTKEHMEDYKEALNYMEKAIKISKTNDMFELLHICYTSVSLLYQYKKNDSTFALRYCNLALEVAERLPDRNQKICETLLIKYEIMIKLGDFFSSKQILQKAYKLKSPNLNDQQTIEKNLKVVAALCYTLDSLVITETNDYSLKKKLYEKMGDGCCIIQNYSIAIDYYVKMLECAQLMGDSEKELVPIYVSLYQTYKDNKQYDLALEYLWKEYEINQNEPIEACNTLLNIAEICEIQLKPFWEIYNVYQKVLNKVQNINNIRLERISRLRLLKLLQKFNMHSLINDFKKESIERGYDLLQIDDESDDDLLTNSENNTPDIGDDIILEDLTDNESDKDDTTGKRTIRKHRNCLNIKKNNKGETQLHQACISGNLNLVQKLLDQGHPLNVRDHAGWLPLHEACNHGHFEIVKLLLQKGSQSLINDKGGTSCDGITPLYDACSNGYLTVVELLLDYGANSTLKTDFGDIPLNILDKWRNTVDLDYNEQIYFEKVRNRMAEQLKKTGVDEVPIYLIGNTLNNSNEFNSNRNLEDLSSDDSDEIKSNSSYSRSRLLFEKENSEQNIDKLLSKQQNMISQISPFKQGNQNSAKKEYKKVMENLKHPNRIQISEISSNEFVTKKRSGFLENDEIDDDWLENDIGPDKKKTKYYSEKNIYNNYTEDCVSLKPNKIIRNHKEDSSSISDVDSIKCDLYNEDSQDAFSIMLESSKRIKTQHKPLKSKNLSLSSSKNKTHKDQQSLFDNGFSLTKNQAKISNDNNIFEINCDSNSLNISNHKNLSITSPTTAKTIVAASISSFKIKIENELLLIPVENKKVPEVNIRWLADEAARRYYNLVGLKPKLRLTTADGFCFEENDPLTVAINENMISAKVIEWQILPLHERYEEMCRQLDVKPIQEIKENIEKEQILHSLVLIELALTSDLVKPLFRAMLHQPLRVLNLSNNFIKDEGLKLLAKSLPTLKELKVLNLEGNCITAEGLQIIGNVISQIEDYQLEELKLSCNPLGDQSIKHLDKICNNLINLKVLHLSDCNITNFYDFDLRFFHLIDFNISFNLLSFECFKNLLNKLNCCRLEKLKLDFTIDKNLELNSISGKIITEFFESGTCEKFKFLSISGCSLTDFDTYSISQCLTKANNLEILDISNNPKLTTITLKYIFEYLKHIKKLYIQECPLIIDNLKLSSINIDSIKNLPNLIVLTLQKGNNCLEEDIITKFWKSCSCDNRKVTVHGNQIKLFVNNCDII